MTTSFPSLIAMGARGTVCSRPRGPIACRVSDGGTDTRASITAVSSTMEEWCGSTGTHEQMGGTSMDGGTSCRLAGQLAAKAASGQRPAESLSLITVMRTRLIHVPYDSGHRGLRMGRGPLHFGVSSKPLLLLKPPPAAAPVRAAQATQEPHAAAHL